MWIVFGTKEASRRVPNGARVERMCQACGETAMFYEKDVTSTFRLYFIDVFDYARHRVMECGACGANYATDELGSRERDLPGEITKRLEEGGQAVGRIASSVGDGVANLAARVVGRDAPRPAPKREAPARDTSLDLSDDDLAALREARELSVDEATEKRFRELEEQDALRKRGGGSEG